jgi:type IV secretory pathway TrbF-like protein
VGFYSLSLFLATYRCLAGERPLCKKYSWVILDIVVIVVIVSTDNVLQQRKALKTSNYTPRNQPSTPSTKLSSKH